MRFRPDSPSIYLPNSGQIDLNAIGVEAGQADNSQTGLNDAAVRDMIGKAANAQNAMSEYYGASSAPPPSNISGNVPTGLTGSYYKAYMPGISGSTTISNSYMGSAGGNPVFAKIGFLRGGGNWLALEYAAGQSSFGTGYSVMKIVVDTLGTVYEGMFYDNVPAEYYTGTAVKFLTTPNDNTGAYQWQRVVGKPMTVTLT